MTSDYYMIWVLLKSIREYIPPKQQVEASPTASSNEIATSPPFPDKVLANLTQQELQDVGERIENNLKQEAFRVPADSQARGVVIGDAFAFIALLGFAILGIFQAIHQIQERI